MSNSDPSFDIDGRTKGSYVRATDDIGRALDTLKVEELPAVASFLFYYLSCEKLAKIMKGVCKGKKKSEIFNPRSRTPDTNSINNYSKQLGCKMIKNNIDCIFASNRQKSARWLRNQIAHEIGPSHAKQIVNEAPRLVPKMKKFLECRKDVVQCLTSRSQARSH